MHFLIKLLIVATALNMAHCQNEITLSQDFLTRLQFSVNESSVPNYIVHVIYGHLSQHNVTTQNILNLYSTSSISLVTAENILDQLNIEHSQVFSPKGLNYTLDLLNITFTTFYNTIIDDLNVRTKQDNFLPLLQIDKFNFYSALISDGDVWSEFSKGNFTRENIEAAAQVAGVTLENVWTNTTKQLEPSFLNYEVESFVNLLKSHGVGETEALVIWKAIPISNQQVYSMPIFDGMVKQVLARARSQSVFGSITGESELIIHRNVYDQFRDDWRILTLMATTVMSKTLLGIDSINVTGYRSFVTLHYTPITELTSLVIIKIAEQNTNLVNCSFVAPFLDGIVILAVPSATYNKDYTYSVPLTVDEVTIGSALVCNDTLYGLAREAVQGGVLVDAFGDFQPPDNAANFLYCWGGLFVLVVMQLVA
ncbi:uncharacterized protein [Euwallacea fornicatus]|uniref:uncharacterized protein n=1 Tax=Euwallacea fornicatus TaxID=995702 RepID=UPI00338E5CA4